tara:strand:- start:32 stop:3628 length:3597 start_codon:yes stop_codon:yes gene_type:complete
MDEIDLQATEEYLNNSNIINIEATEEYYREPLRFAEDRKPDFVDTGIIIGAEILGPVLGSAFGPKGIIIGSALGNYASQKYRIAKGFQSDIGKGELATATALGAVPVGRLANVGTAGKTAIRAGQGAGLATAELTARTMIDEDRAPTRDEIATTLLFGGVFGGTLGAAEAKWMSDNIGTEVSEGMTRADAVKAIGKDIKDANGVNNAKVGSPILEKIDTEGLSNIKDPEEVADKLLLATEVKLLDEVDTALGNLAKRPPLEEGTKSFDTPTMERGALDSFSQPSFSNPSGRQGILGGEPVMEDAVSQMANIQKTLDDEIAQQNEIFKPILRQNEIGAQKQTELGIQRLGDTDEIARIRERLSILDHRLGKGKGARQERARLNADLKRIYKRNGMNLLDLQDDMRRAQMSPNEPAAGMRDRPMKQADPMTKEDRMAEGFLGKGYEKYFSTAFTAGTGAVGVASMFTEDEENEMKQAGFHPLMFAVLAAAGFGPKAFRKFKKTPTYKKTQAQVKADPVKTAPDSVKAEKINEGTADNPFIPPSRASQAMRYAKEFVSDALVPLSRKLKNIDPTLTRIFREHERKINKNTVKYLDRTAPFITSMTKRLKGNEKKQREFKLHLLNGDMAKIRIMLDDLKVSDQVGREFTEMQKAFNDIRNYARQEGGIDVGYQEGYFPRLIKDYKSFRSALQGDDSNAVTKALEEYAQKEGLDSVESIPEGVAAEITSRALRGFPVQPGASLPGNLKGRKIGQIKDERMIDGYADPADALKNYVERTVQAVERRKFLYRNPNAKGEEVGFDGSKDRQGADLGMDMEVDDTLAGQVAQRLLKDRNDLSPEDVEKLKEIIQARFSGKTVDPFIQGVKNLNYIQVMGNFGSAITQLGDLAYSIYFNGFDNTFKSLFNQKENFDFVKYFNLKDHNIDAATSTGGLSSALDKVFTVTGLKKLDQLAKNTTMNASWKKYKAQAMKNSQALQDDLTPVFGKERAGQMVKELRESNPASGDLPKGVEELIWYKFLDVNPATLGEMPKLYNQSGNARIMYMLKSFTVKQFDVFREAAQKDIDRANEFYKKGNKKQAAKAAAEAVSKIAGLGLVFGAANASTDMIKDTLYGRPIKRDELFEDNLWRLIGINRYIVNKARREGPAKATLEMLLPPTAIFDRGWQDISAIVGDGEYKGAMLQGTPLDMVYWKYLGGLDKIQNSD